MKNMYPHAILICAILALANSPITYAYDYYKNTQEMSHLDRQITGKGKYIASWFDPDSCNYFALIASADSGLTIIKTTDPENPIKIARIPMDNGADVKVIGNYAYASEWGWGGLNPTKLFYIIPLIPTYPYFNTLNIVTIPFSDTATTEVGSLCDTIPIHGLHTMYAKDNYICLTEDGDRDLNSEIAVLDVSANPLAPILAGLIDTTGISDTLYSGAHSVSILGDTMYVSQWMHGEYKLVSDPGDNFRILS